MSIRAEGDPIIDCPVKFLAILKALATVSGVDNSLSVSYDYEPPKGTQPVPEPATYFAGIGALAMLCFFGKAKRVSS